MLLLLLLLFVESIILSESSCSFSLSLLCGAVVVLMVDLFVVVEGTVLPANCLEELDNDDDDDVDEEEAAAAFLVEAAMNAAIMSELMSKGVGALLMVEPPTRSSSLPPTVVVVVLCLSFRLDVLVLLVATLAVEGADGGVDEDAPITFCIIRSLITCGNLTIIFFLTRYFFNLLLFVIKIPFVSKYGGETKRKKKLQNSKRQIQF
jgi:hypothetical protein